MERQRVPYQKILFVCVNERQPHETCCARRDSLDLAESLKARIKLLGLSRAVRVSKSGCQDLCAKGPNVMVFPDQLWYHDVSLHDVEAIINDVVRSLPASPSQTAPPPSFARSPERQHGKAGKGEASV